MKRSITSKPPSQRLFVNARVIDPSQDLDIHADMLVTKGKIAAIGKDLPRDKLKKSCKIIDCKGMVLAPGLVDARVFIGEPGGEHRETIKSASRAAASGGVTSLVMMPDTDPVIDDAALVEFVRQTAREKSRIRILPSAALSKGQRGEEMTEIGLLSKAGAVAFTDGRQTIDSAQMMRRALTYAGDFDALIMAATRDNSLGGGVMNAGLNATRMGLPGIPREAEIIPLERDMRVVAMTRGRYHASTLSTSDSVDVISRARDKGLDVSAGVAVANLALNDNDIGSYRTFFRVSPPLRNEDDRLAMVDGIRTGKIDIICSNHDPQDVDTKRLPFAEAADGAIGLESMLAATLRLHHTDGVPLSRLLYCLSTGPAKRLGLKSGTLEIGAAADIILLDPDMPWILQEEELLSRSRNTAFEGARFQGRVLKTFVDGRTVFSRDA
ncbi:MAG: dihydroorotase [Rhizobiaceae bacterium]|nr:dihydroorotase [Hyphomicrobiales bacterium]NRB31428.1 dihydroorotase [Rhizobiaceae bacterium]